MMRGMSRKLASLNDNTLPSKTNPTNNPLINLFLGVVNDVDKELN